MKQTAPGRDNGPDGTFCRDNSRMRVRNCDLLFDVLFLVKALIDDVANPRAPSCRINVTFLLNCVCTAMTYFLMYVSFSDLFLLQQ